MKLTAILAVGAAVTLGGCAVDSHMGYVSYLPDSLKQASPAVAVEAPPDVLAILRGNVNAVFASTSAPTNIQYTLPVPAKHGWETCVKANVMGATGKPLGERTYLVNIDHNQIGDRQDASDRCASETYRTLQQHDEIASR